MGGRNGVPPERRLTGGRSGMWFEPAMGRPEWAGCCVSLPAAIGDMHFSDDGTHVGSSSSMDRRG